MPADNPSERDLLRESLAPGRDCIPVEKLEACLDSIPADLAAHLGSCAHCQCELSLLRSFMREPDGEEAAAVQAVAKRLRVPEVGPTPLPWWKGLLQLRWFSPAAVAAAAMLIAVAAGLEWRHSGAPRLTVPNQPEAEVLRSGSISGIAPEGDLTEVPSRIRWQPVAGAARYQVQLLEVDHTELWSTVIAESQVEIPPAVQAKIVPAKTLLLQVTALNGAGAKLAESGFIRFRLLQKVYSH